MPRESISTKYSYFKDLWKIFFNVHFEMGVYPSHLTWNRYVQKPVGIFPLLNVRCIEHHDILFINGVGIYSNCDFEFKIVFLE